MDTIAVQKSNEQKHVSTDVKSETGNRREWRRETEAQSHIGDDNQNKILTVVVDYPAWSTSFHSQEKDIYGFSRPCVRVCAAPNGRKSRMRVRTRNRCAFFSGWFDWDSLQIAGPAVSPLKGKKVPVCMETEDACLRTVCGTGLGFWCLREAC